jgi:tetratricopeptide (TPR) repeat protein
MTPDWYFQQDGRECGPFTMVEIEQRATAGLIGPGTLIRREATPWNAASEFPFLSACFKKGTDQPEPLPDAITGRPSPAGTAAPERTPAPAIGDSVDDPLARIVVKPPLPQYGGEISRLAAMLFLLGAALFTIEQLLRASLIETLVTTVVWSLLFGIPAAVCYRAGWRGRAMIGIATLFFLAAGLELAVRAYTVLVLRPQLEQPLTKAGPHAEGPQAAQRAPIDLDPVNEAKVFFDRGCASLQRNEYDKAIGEFSEAIRLNPTSGSNFSFRGDAWYNKDDYDKAIKDYDEAIRLDPSDGLAFSSRGRAWLYKQEYDRAISDLNEGIRLRPQYPFSYFYRGHAWLEKKDYDGAIKDYDTFVRLIPGDHFAFLNRGIARCAKGEYDRAIEDFDKAIRLCPTNGAGFRKRADAWFYKREYDQAIKDLDEAIRLNPKDGDAFHKRAATLSEKSEYDRALKDFDEAIRLIPKPAATFANRGLMWYRRKEYDRAIKDFDEAIRLDAEIAGAFGNRGLAWYAKGEYDRAIRDFDAAIRLDPKETLSRRYRTLAATRKQYKENPVWTFKEKLRRGMTVEQVREFSDPADKTESYGGGVLLPEFNYRVPFNGSAFVARFVPFEAPGAAAPRYRVNLLFAGSQGDDFPLTDWYFRSRD